MIQTIILLVFKMLLFNSSPTYQGPWRPNDEARWLVITSRIQPTPKVRSPINGSLQFRFQTPTQDRGFGILFFRPDLISNKFGSHDIGDISRVWLHWVCPLVYLLSKYLVFQPFIISVNDGNYRNALWALNLTLMFFCYYPYLRYIRSYLYWKVGVGSNIHTCISIYTIREVLVPASPTFWHFRMRQTFVTMVLERLVYNTGLSILILLEILLHGIFLRNIIIIFD